MATTRSSEDARHYRRQTPGTHEIPFEQRPDIFVPHYQNHCSCFSCRWLRETRCPFILSKLQCNDWPYPVVNPTYNRVPQDERQRLLTPVAKNSSQIMYIYAMQFEDKSWGWVVVLPLPLLPFLLTGDQYSGMSRVARHPEHGWYGLSDKGEQVEIGHAMPPPLHNPLYQYYGYDARCSPYFSCRIAYEDKTSDSMAYLSPDDDTDPSPQIPTEPSPQIPTEPSPKIISSTSRTTTVPSCNSKTDPTLVTQTAPPVMDHVTPVLDKLAGMSTEVHPNSSKSSAQESPAGDDERPENPERVVIDPRCTNSPEPSGDRNHWGCDLGHNGKYNRQRGDNRHTDRRNTTIFVGGLNKNMTQEELHYWFEGYGELMYVRKKVNQTCGFVQYPSRQEAEMAMSQMQGFPVHGARLRLSWGSPKKHIDLEYWGFYKESTWEAHKGWESFDARMKRGEARREDDPSFW